MADHENDIFWTTNGLKYLENQFPELKMGYSYDAIIQNEVYQKVSDMFFFGVLRRVGPKQVSPIIFGFKKTSSGKKITPRF